MKRCLYMRASAAAGTASLQGREVGSREINRRLVSMRWIDWSRGFQGACRQRPLEQGMEGGERSKT